MNGIGINPNVASVTPKVNFQGVTRIAGKRPDINETINTFKNSGIGKFIIDKAKDAFQYIKEGNFKGLFNTAKEFFKNFSKKGIVKNGIEFVKNVFQQLAKNETVKKVISSVTNVFKKA